jgi:hypothetical protein
MTKRTADQLKRLQQFDLLPDDCIVDEDLSALVLDISRWTLGRNNPVPRIQISPRRFGRRAGDLRRLLRGELAAVVAA